MSASWINKLNESDSRLHKEDVIKQAHAASILGNDISFNFLKLLRYCYNPYITFGVRQIPDTTGIIDAENPWDEFGKLLDTLIARELTGNDARNAIEEMSHRFDSEEWNTFLAPVLRRDVRAGISDKTINKILKRTEFEVPKFGCQLATNCEGRPEMRGIKRLEPKLDGVRVLMVVNIDNITANGRVSVTSYSRNGKVFDNFSAIEKQIRSKLSLIGHVGVNIRIAPMTFTSYDGFVLDGEVVGNSFQELMRQARRKTDVQTDDSVFHVFDILPLTAFIEGHWNAQLSKRIDILEKMRDIVDQMPNVELLPHIEVNLDTEEGQAELQSYASNMVAQGFEGIMIKNLDAPYECDRSTAWMKYKPVYDFDLTVIGIEPGTGKNKGRMGALVCEGDDDGKHIIVNVGSGYTDVERQTYWDDQADIIGRTVVVMADAVTLNQSGTYSLRFPRFKTFRYDK